jgi:hypothetical protein
VIGHGDAKCHFGSNGKFKSF